MTADQGTILAILAGTMAMFLWGRWRHDMVALAALLACVATGSVSAHEAFAGFGHPAVITVASVLVLSRGLLNTGAVDALTRLVLPRASGPTVTLLALTGLAATLSAFMNNVGALALLMPVAMQIAARQHLSPGPLLMPIAFASVLGGMTTLIGTPPNLIVSAFRANETGSSFAMFDFTPVGLAVALCGVAFIVLVGWRLVPARERASTAEFETGAYLTEAHVAENSKAAGMTLHEIEQAFDEADAQVVGLIRNEVRVPAPEPWRKIQAGDILVIAADPKALAGALSALHLTLEEAVQNNEKRAGAASDEARKQASKAGTPSHTSTDSAQKKPTEAEKRSHSDDITLMELAVLPDSILVGRSASDIRLRTRFGVNLLAISRQGRRSIARLRTTPLRAGDVLLMQGAPEAVAEFAWHFGCVPLAERMLRLPNKRQALMAGAILATAVTGAAFGLVPAAIAFVAGVLASMALGITPPRTIYDSVDWPVIVLLGALIPVAGAVATTGAADLIVRLIFAMIGEGHAIVALAAILIVTMTLSDFMNNAATAALMCPIAIGAANNLGASADPFLMAVAVGASCAFLTPIGHQNNTLILGPGGFRFGDYWRLGLPLEAVVLIVAVPALALAWPL